MEVVTVHNRSRGVVLAGGAMVCTGMAIGSLYAPLYTTTQYLPNYSPPYDPTEIDGWIGLWKTCVSVNSVSQCQDTLAGMRCDDLANQFKLMRGFYCATAALIGLVIFSGAFDAMGCLRNRLVHVLLLIAAAATAAIGFAITVVTYGSTYCGFSISGNTQVVSMISAAPFVLGASGCGALVGLAIAALLKDKPAVAAPMSTDYLLPHGVAIQNGVVVQGFVVQADAPQTTKV